MTDDLFSGDKATMLIHVVDIFVWLFKGERSGPSPLHVRVNEFTL